MTAKHKLNGVHTNGALGLAILMGLLTQSWFVFFVTLFTVFGIAVHTGDIR